MMPDIISEGEAFDFRTRLGAIERRVSESETRTSVHEEKCAGRYKLILVMVAANILINIPSAWPRLMAFLEMLR